MKIAVGAARFRAGGSGMNPTEKYNFDKRTQETLEHLTVPFAVYQFVDKRVVTLVLSDGFCRLFGYEDRGQAYYDMDNDMYKDVHPDDVARIANAAYDFATKGGKYEVVYRTKIMGGPGYRIVHAYGEHVYTDTGVRLAHVWYSDEGIYTEQAGQQGTGLNQSLSNALHENSIVNASRYDYLTGLPNMTYFFELAKAGKEAAQKKGVKYVLLYMNFSGMKHFNMKHGFSEGDTLLQSFAKILAETFGNEQSCRIGADHFAVLTEETDLEEKLRQLFRECREMNGGKMLPVHVGVYVGRNEDIHVSVACDRAKLACTALGGRYETAVNYYRQELSEEADHKRYIIENIDRAIKEKWIQMYLQPIIRTVTERVCDVEALARWIDPEKGFLSPADFIPALEDAGLIYKLDLYMVDQILDSMKEEKAAGFYIVPHSVNFSRSDFDACDIVEEIRRRVDEAGVDRALITIEITESIIGSDLAFMKEQVERFRNLGFPVWMDDFGSGYSSLDVLQSIQFDLIKFDMSFMRKLDEGNGGKIILTELMKMAASLGVDTVCEGVETGEQVHFLQEIGCSKLQGFYFSKPISLETLKALRESNTLIPRENPQESKYYERIGRVNLFDLSFLANLDDSVTKNTFDTVPMAIMEVNADRGKVKYIRSNQTFRDFMKRAFGFNLSDPDLEYPIPQEGPGSNFMKAIEKSKDDNNRAFVDEKMHDGTAVRSFVRIIGKNPVNGRESVAIAVLSVREPDEDEKYAEIAKKLQEETKSLGRIAALSPDYIVLYTVDTATGHYTQYNPSQGFESFGLAKQGDDFFADVVLDAPKAISPEDMERHLRIFTKENVLHELHENGFFIHNYRMIMLGKTVPVTLRATLVKEADGEKIILGVTNDEEEQRRKLEEERREEERIIYARLHALTGNYIVVYVVDPETGNYREFTATANYEESLKQAKEGKDFFTTVREAARIHNYPEDLNRFLSAFTKENVMAEVERSGIFTLSYRFVIEGRPVYVQLKAAMVEEKEGQRLVVGLVDVDAQVRQEKELGNRLAQAQAQANIDALTGIKNKHAFLVAKEWLDRQIAGHNQPPFAVVILDVNDLKKVNDTSGHQAGDQYLRDACKIICETFKRSPVFRVGGDEFAVISQGSDYERIETLMGEVNAHNAEALRTSGIVIACGMAKFDNDVCVDAVLERADRNMYQNKSKLKARK